MTPSTLNGRQERGCRHCCQGAHIMPLGWDDTVPMIVEQLD